MTDTTTQTDDGGHVTMTVTGQQGDYTAYVQKYDASGAPVGPHPTPYDSYDAPKLVPLAGGGFVLAVDYPQRYGAVLGGYVFDAAGTRINSFGGQTDWHVAASPLGGFVVTSIAGSPDFMGGFPSYPEGTSIRLYDTAGHLVDEAPVQSYGSPTISVDGSGLYHVNWSDGELQHSLAIDPRSPPDLTPPAAPAAFQLVDDQGPETGTVASGGVTDDTTPMFRVPVSEVGAVGVTSSQSGTAHSPPTIHFVAVTQADVDRGYVDLAVRSGRSDGTFADGTVTVTARVEDANGIISGETSETFTIQADYAPELTDANHQSGQFNELGLTAVSESSLPYGTSPDAAALTRAGAFYVRSLDGVSSLSIAGHTVVDHGAFTSASWDVNGLGTLTINGYDAASGRVDYSFTLQGPYDNTNGSRASTTQEHVVVTDNDGDRAEGNFYIRVDDDGLRANDDATRTQAGGPAVSGDLLANDRSADGVQFAGFVVPAGANAYILTGAHGSLSVDASGHYTYRANADAAAGTDSFQYRVRTHEGDSTTATLTVTVDAADQPPAPGTITSPGPGSTVNGTSGDDTIYASQGPDVITTGSGADVVAFRDLPWNAGHVTDFQLGSDHLDLSAIFAASGYEGSDPVADGRMRLEDDGAGGTKVYFDRDAPNYGDWPFLITTLDHVSATGLTWGQLAAGGSPSSPPPPPPPPPSSGEVITSPAPGSNVSGTSGSDTIYASQGPDTITTGSGSDVVAFRDLPWNAGHVTDFQLGSDHLDLSAIFQASGYTGSDPVADGRMRFEDDGAGGTRIYFDRDQANGGDWPFLITTLDHVSASGLTWAQLSTSASAGGGGGEGGGSGGPAPGEVITSDQYGDTLAGGSGDDTLNAGQGPDTLTGNGGADHFTFNDLPWRAGVITDFTPGVDKLDLRPLFQAAGYSGTDPIGDHHLEFRDDGQGNTAVYFDRDDPNAGDWPFFITTLQGVTPGQIGSGDWMFR